MRESPTAPLRVAVISQSQRQRVNLRRILEGNGLHVVADQALSECRPGHLDAELADVLLIDLDESFEHELNSLDVLIEQSSLPILFNDGEVGYLDADARADEWGRKLVSKLGALVGSAPVKHSLSASPEPAAPYTGVERRGLRVIASSEQAGVERAQHVWVLGASIGGPQAIRQFLNALPHNVPAAFVVAQHIGANFIDLLTEQLNRDTALPVRRARDGQMLCHGEAVVVPIGQRLVINRVGELELHPAGRDAHLASIDLAMMDIADRYGAGAGAILFSGMGNDGLRGARHVIQQGGVVWAQDAASCVISTMADHARQAGLVSVIGTPAELAGRLMQNFRM